MLVCFHCSCSWTFFYNSNFTLSHQNKRGKGGGGKKIKEKRNKDRKELISFYNFKFQDSTWQKPFYYKDTHKIATSLYCIQLRFYPILVDSDIHRTANQNVKSVAKVTLSENRGVCWILTHFTNFSQHCKTCFVKPSEKWNSQVFHWKKKMPIRGKEGEK